MLRVIALTVVMSGVLVGGCGDDGGNAGIECVEHAHCNLDSTGQCVQAPSGRKFCAYGDATCPSGLRYSDLDVGDGLSGICVAEELPDGGVLDAPIIDATPATDGAIDAMVPDASIPQPDAAVGTHFDVVYASEMAVGPFTSFGVFAFEVVIINTGTTPLQMATVEVSVAGQPSEAPISFMFTEESHDGTVVIAPGEAYGDLDAAQLQALVPETVVGSGNIAKVIFADVPNPDSGTRPRTVSGAIGLITINGQTAVLPFDVLLREGSSGSEPSSWQRVSTP